MKKILGMLVIASLMLSMVFVAPPTHAAEATIWTDKGDYAYYETVTIFGSGFEALANVTVTIVRPDKTSDGVYAVTDDTGSFTCTYQLNGIAGTYTVTATDGTNTATTTFTEGAITPELWGYNLEPHPGWTHGDVKGYYECEWVPYKIEIENAKENGVTYTLTVVVHHDYYDGTYYGLDDVRNWQMWRDGVPVTPTISGPVINGSESGIQQLQWSWTFTTTSTKTPKKDEHCTLTFEVHVAIGAHSYPGSKVHTHIHDITSWPPTSISSGHRDVPIVVKGPPPEADIAIEKTGVTYAHEGDIITYQFTVRNNGPGTAYNVQVTDNMLGSLTGYLPDTTLDINEVNTFSVDYVVPTPSGDITNTVTVTSTTSDPDTTNNQDTWTVDVLHPGICVTKTANATQVHYCDWVEYTITVVNTGDCPLYVVKDDPVLGLHWEGWLAPGQVHVEVVKYHPEADPTINTVTVTGTDELGRTVDGEDSCTVDILHPGIHVTKTGPECAHEDDTITYTITVTNTGDCPLYSVLVTDTLLSPPPIYSNGLAVGETKTFNVNYHVPSPSGDISNTVTASGYDALGRQVSDTASWTVDVLHPSIYVIKTVNATEIHYCDWVEYTITVVNTGDCPLYVVKDDPTLGLHWEGLLNPGESHVEKIVFHPEADPTINTVTVTGTDELGKTVEDEDSCTVDILYPGIYVTKTANATQVHYCDWVEYTITVVNTGDCPLYVVKDDPVLGLHWEGWLAPGQVHVEVVDYHPEDDPTINTVTVTGTDELGKTVSDSASWTVDILHPDIDVAKSGPLYAHECDTITYTIIITNAGDCPLYVVKDDPLLGLHWEGWLAPGQVHVEVVDYHPEDDPTINTVTVTGTDELGKTVSDSASWTVDILHPGIHVTKTGPARARECETITYTITVHNTGDCPLYSVFVTDTLLGPIWSNGFLDPCETKTFTVSYHVPICSGDIYNTVTASGSDILGLSVSDSASWFVKIQYYLTVKTDPLGLVVIPGEGWYDGCTTVTLTAPLLVQIPPNSYIFDHWDVDTTSKGVGVNTIIVHMSKNHTATAHYWLSIPRHLDAEPPRLIDLTKPVCTQWDELYPDYGRHYHLDSWHDTNGNGKLDPSDFIDLWDKDRQEKAYPYWWHMDDVTVTLELTDSYGRKVYVEFEGSYDDFLQLAICKNYVGTQWHEVYPIYCNQYRLVRWIDNCDGTLSPCDQIILQNKATGEQTQCHVDGVKTDLIISPRVTLITIGKTKNFLGQGYPQIIPVRIDNYYANTTIFTVAAYYNGLQPIGNQTITLNPLESGDAIIEWIETATWPKGTYTFTITIKTYADSVLIDVKVFTITFKITIVGDLNGDGKVSGLDISQAAKAFASYGPDFWYPGSPPHPRWNPDADINGDNKIDGLDITTVARNFGKADP